MPLNPPCAHRVHHVLLSISCECVDMLPLKLLCCCEEVVCILHWCLAGVYQGRQGQSSCSFVVSSRKTKFFCSPPRVRVYMLLLGLPAGADALETFILDIYLRRHFSFKCCANHSASGIEGILSGYPTNLPTSTFVNMSTYAVYIPQASLHALQAPCKKVIQAPVGIYFGAGPHHPPPHICLYCWSRIAVVAGTLLLRKSSQFQACGPGAHTGFSRPKRGTASGRCKSSMAGGLRCVGPDRDLLALGERN